MIEKYNIYTGKASDFEQLGKEYTLPNQQKSVWEQFFTGITQQYENLAQETQSAASYDISEAYANYKKQQLQLQLNQNLGTGFKETVNTQLQKDYASAFKDIRAQESSALSKITAQYAGDIASTEEEIAKYGQYAENISEIMNEFSQNVMGLNIGDINVDGATKNAMLTPYTEGGLGWFTENVDEYGNIVTELTDLGREHYQELLFSDKYSKQFAEFFMERDPELYSEFLKNQDFYQQVIGGLEYGQRRYDKELLPSLMAEEKKTSFNQIATNDENKDVLTFLYGENFDKIDAKQARDIAQNTKRTEYYITTADSPIGGIGTTFTDEYGKSWRTTDYNKIYSLSGSSSTDSEALNMAKSLGIFDGRIFDTSKYKKNDIIFYNGRFYIITDLSNKNFGYREVSLNYENVPDGAVERLF